MTQKRIRCWHCLGKRQLFSFALPGDPKPTWHACPTCQGQGWTELTEGNHEKLQDALYWDQEDDDA